MNEFIKKITYISLFFHILAAIFSSGFHHFDEHFQIFEFLNLKLGGTVAGDLPWEYREQVRPWFQIFVYYLVSKPLYLVGIKSPFFMAFYFRLLTSMMGWFALVKCYPLIDDWFEDIKTKKIAWMLLHLSWFVPYIQTRTSSGSFGISFFLFGLVYFWKYRNSKSVKLSNGIICGLLFGFSYLSRSQMALSVACLWFWAIFIDKSNKNFLGGISLGVILTIVMGVLIDSWGYGNWTFSTWHYFRMNFLGGIFASVQHYPWYWYFRWTLLRGMPPYSLFLIISTVYFWLKYPKHLLTWVSLPLFIFHSYLGHKELRYIYPVIILAPFALAFLHQEILKKRPELLEKKLILVIAKITLYINFAFLVISCLRPANPSVSFYKFVYDNPHIRNIIAVEEDPYLMLNLKNKFYRPENLEVSVVKTFADIQLENNIFVWFNKGHHILAMASEKNCTMIYSAYPKWSLNFNIGNWLSRSRFWSLYSCGVN